MTPPAAAAVASPPVQIHRTILDAWLQDKDPAVREAWVLVAVRDWGLQIVDEYPKNTVRNLNDRILC